MDIKAIDIHSHFNHGVVGDTTTDETRRVDIEHLEKVQKAANIEMAFCSTFSSVLITNRIAQENDYLFEYAQSIDWLWQWVVIDPRIEKTFEQARKMLKHGKCVGIKLHPLCHKYSLEEYADKLFSFASEFGAIVQIHPEKPADYIVPIADKYPDVKFIMAHLGDVNYVNAIEWARHGNVYTDTSGIASSKNNMVEYAVERVGSERILFGTDTYAAGFQRGRIEYALITDKDKENILRNNAIRLFGELNPFVDLGKTL